MKNMQQKMRLIIGMMIALLIFSLTGKSDVAHAGEISSETERRWVVNPFYAHLYDENEVYAKRYEAGYDVKDEGLTEKLPIFYDEESLYKYVKQQLIQRSTLIQVLVDEDATINIWDAVSDAFIHTEDCSGQEGDYLRRAWKSYGVNNNLYNVDYRLVSYDVEYQTTREQEEQLTVAVNAALKELNLSGKSEYEKVKAIYTYICDHVDYDNSYNKYSAYHALCTGKAVCDGYAQLFYRMCKDAGLSTRIIIGHDFIGNGHAWNIVKIDGLSYYVDATWDGQDTETRYEYFLKSEEDFSGHFASDTRYDVELLKHYKMADESYVEPGKFKAPLNLDNPHAYLYTYEDKLIDNQANGRPKVLVYYFKCNFATPIMYSIGNGTYPGVDIITINYSGDDKETPKAYAETYSNKDIKYCYTPSGGYGNGLANYTDITGWSDNMYIAYIDANNKFQAATWDTVSEGEIKQYLEYYCGMNFKEETVKATNLAIGHKYEEIEVGRTYQLQRAIWPADVSSTKLNYSSSNTSVLKIDNDGKMTPVGEGTAIITVKTTDGSNITRTKEFTVYEPYISIRLIEFAEKKVILRIGDKYQLNPKVRPANATDKEISYTTTGRSVQISDTGEVIAIAPGTSRIYAKPASGGTNAKDYIDIRVISDITSFSILPSNLTMTVGGGTGSLYADIKPNTAMQDVTWSSSNPRVAKVDEEGIVTPISPGTVTITATAVDGSGKTATCAITVISGDSTGGDGTGDNQSGGLDDSSNDGWNDGSNDDYLEEDYWNDEGELRLENGQWMYYKNGVVDRDTYGYIWYNDGIFLVANGTVASAINGLAQDPNNPEDWYFLSGGQVQSYYTGLAEYDGQWFYIDGGKLNTKLADYVEYDGGLFYVGAGRIMKEVSGLAQNPSDESVWYYVAEGQVQSFYTGLAQYDSAWFYVENGVLASNYTGTVEYDGSIFNVVNGQLAN